MQFDYLGVYLAEKNSHTSTAIKGDWTNLMKYTSIPIPPSLSLKSNHQIRSTYSLQNETE